MCAKFPDHAQQLIGKMSINCLRLFVVVYKHVNLMYRCTVTVVVYYRCRECFMLIEIITEKV